MTGRHRKPSSSTGLRLSRVGALAVLATAPLVAVGTASASPSAGSAHTPERRSHDSGSDHGKSSDHDGDYSDDDHSDDGRDNDGRDNDYVSTARHRARTAHVSTRRAHPGVTRPVTTTRSRSSSQSSSTRSTDAQWDRVADCESSQNWSANTGNGYKGGLQFSDATWRAYGGSSYAPSADKASREEQIAVAKKIQRDKGSSAWPSCGSGLGGT